MVNPCVIVVKSAFRNRIDINSFARLLSVGQCWSF